MKYSKGYKYKLEEDEVIHLPPLLQHRKERRIETPFFILGDYTLLIKKGYAWDGVSGPAPDTEETMVPSLFHDCWYQLIREGYVSIHTKPEADYEFRDMLVRRGYWTFLANLYLWALEEYGMHYAKTGREIIVAQ